MKRTLATLAGTALMTSAMAASALEIDRQDVALGAVNARFIDLGFTAGTGFNGVRNTVELQISTTPTDYATPFTDEQLVGFGFPAGSNVGGVDGLGSMASGDSVNWLYFNFNPAKDISKLKLEWTGDIGFPLPGADPVAILVMKDGIAGGSGGLFDIAINFGGNGASALGPDATYSYSKLLFTYDNGDTNIDISDFLGFSAAQGPGVVAGGALVTSGDLTQVVAIPEPSTYAMLAAGLLAVGFAMRRQQR